jgi:hypothetical protein
MHYVFIGYDKGYYRLDALYKPIRIREPRRPSLLLVLCAN